MIICNDCHDLLQTQRQTIMQHITWYNLPTHLSVVSLFIPYVNRILHKTHFALKLFRAFNDKKMLNSKLDKN